MLLGFVCCVALAQNNPAPIFPTSLAGAQYNILNYATNAADSYPMFKAAHDACVKAGGGSILVPTKLNAAYQVIPWQYGTSLPLDNKCPYVLESEVILQTLPGVVIDGFDGSVIGYPNGGGVSVCPAPSITCAYESSGASTSGNYSTGIVCLGHCIIDGNMYSNLVNNVCYGNATGVKYYGTALKLIGYPIEIRNFCGDGVYDDFAGTTPPNSTNGAFHNLYINLNTHNNGLADTAIATTCSSPCIVKAGAVGFRHGGPTDSQSFFRVSSNNAAESMYCGPSGAGFQDHGPHDWGVTALANGSLILPTDLIECASYRMVDGDIEGAGTNSPNIAIIAATANIETGLIYTVPSEAVNAIGIQWGQMAADASFANSINQTTPGNPIAVAGAATAFAATEGNQGCGVTIYNMTSTVGHYDYFRYEGQGTYCGLLDATNEAGTGLYFTGFNVQDSDVSKLVGVGHTDCQGVIVNCEKAIQVLTTGATINLRVGNAQISKIPVSEAGNVTGIIVQIGVNPASGPMCILNTSAYTIGFAAVGTSNMSAAAVTAGIAANSKQCYQWEDLGAGGAAWY